MFAADPLATFYDGQLKGVESDVMGLAGAMPADKYNFAPTDGVVHRGADFRAAG